MSYSLDKIGSGFQFGKKWWICLKYRAHTFKSL